MAHDSFEEDYELASGNSFHISQAQAAEWHTKLVEAEKEIAALRAAAEKAREALKVSWTVLRDLRDDWRCVAGAESIQYIRADNAHENSLAALAALEEVLK